MFLRIESYSKAPHFLIYFLSTTPPLKYFLALSKNTIKGEAINEFLYVSKPEATWPLNVYYIKSMNLNLLKGFSLSRSFRLFDQICFWNPLYEGYKLLLTHKGWTHDH